MNRGSERVQNEALEIFQLDSGGSKVEACNNDNNHIDHDAWILLLLCAHQRPPTDGGRPAA